MNLHTGKLFFRISKTRTHYTTRLNFWPMVLPTIWQLETFCQKLKFRETTSANLFFFKMGQTMPNYTSFLYVTLLQGIFVSACPTYISRLYFIIICRVLWVSVFTDLKNVFFFCVFQILWKVCIVMGSGSQTLASYI